MTTMVDTNVRLISTVAGTGSPGFGGDGGPATSAMLHFPVGVAVRRNTGDVYIADWYNHRIRKVDTTGTITTIAGNGTAVFSGDGGPATSAGLNSPTGVAVSRTGEVYITEWGLHRVRKVDATGTINTIAGTGIAGSTGDGGPASSARLYAPFGVAVSSTDELHIADWGNHRVRKVDATGTINTIAGTGIAGFSGDGGPATSAKLFYPSGAAIDHRGVLYIADEYNHRVRKVDTTGTITTIAGTDGYGFNGDGQATSSTLFYPLAVAVSSSGTVYIADWYNHRVREVDTAGYITTIAGTGQAGFNGDGQATSSHLYYPAGVALGRENGLHISDEYNHRVRRTTTTVPDPTAPEQELRVYQDSVPDAAPGARTKFNVGIRARTEGHPVDPGVIEQRFTAPTGFVFSGQPTYGYYWSTDHTGHNVEDYRIEDGGRTLVITSNPHVNTDPDGSDRGALVYTFPVEARSDAETGEYADGEALIGKHNSIPLKGAIRGDVERRLRVYQESGPDPQGRPGDTSKFNFVLAAPDEQPVNPGVIEQRFTAPTGFLFTGAVTYGYYFQEPKVSDTLHDVVVADGGRTMLIRSNPHVNTSETDREQLIYTIAVKVAHDAIPGAHEDGAATIGRHTPVPLSGNVLP